jgi:hypothetical protein
VDPNYLRGLTDACFALWIAISTVSGETWRATAAPMLINRKSFPIRQIDDFRAPRNKPRPMFMTLCAQSGSG